MGFRAVGRLMAWQAGSLLEKFNTQFAGSVTYGKFAVKDFQSVNLWFAPEVNDQRVTINWYAYASATIPLATRQIDVRTGSTAYLTLPNAGAFIDLVVQEAGPGNGQHSVALFPTDRSGPSLALPSSVPLVNHTGLSLGAGLAQETFFTPWYAGPAVLAARAEAQPGLWYVNSYDFAGGQTRTAYKSLPAGSADTLEFFVPPGITSLVIFNSGAGTGSFAGSVVPDHLRS